MIDMTINIMHGQRNTLPRKVLIGMHRLRHQVFNERLHWNLKTFKALEVDQFDNNHSDYIIAEDNAGNIIGCWRLLSTTKKYMLKEVFHFMLGDEVLPKSDKIWELSRFAIADKESVQYILSETTVYMIKEIIAFALRKEISAYITVTSIGVERLMKSAGMPLKRIGIKKPIAIDGIKSVLCIIPINKQFISATDSLMKKYESSKLAV
jgi:acyl homoserine lactone synthase